MAKKRKPGRPKGSKNKKGPGRPPGSKNKRGPGRPPGSKNKNSSKTVYAKANETITIKVAR